VISAIVASSLLRSILSQTPGVPVRFAAGFGKWPGGSYNGGRKSPPAEVHTMTRKKLSRNAPCPCGSGKKYKNCCWDKDFEWIEDEAGTVYKSVPMSPEVREALEQLRQAFVAKHGREPGPDDPLFPDMPHPEHLEAMMVEDMKAAGLDPAFIYAFEKTGLLVTEQNQHLIPEEDLAEWDAAIEEYEARHRGQEGTG
jgi:SEC-C motif